MPHLVKRVCLIWGSSELDGYIDHLIMDSRDGKRQGLPVDISEELLFLQETNRMVRAIDLARQQKIPYREALRMVEEIDHQRHAKGPTLADPLAARDVDLRERGPERRQQADRRAAPRPGSPDRRSGLDRRHAATEPDEGLGALFGKLVFKLATHKIVLALIIAALVGKLLWPYFFPSSG